MISNIKVKNFKCFENIEFELGKVNLLAGANGCGKSSFIQVLLLLRQSVERNKELKSLELYGKYINLGLAKEVIYEETKNNELQIEIWNDENKHIGIYPQYDAEKYILETKIGSLIDENNKRLEVDIPNIANAEHLDIHRKKLGIRKYEFNPKHKINVGWGTEMDLNDDEAQKLLLYALPVDREENHLVAKKNGKYYSFRCHHGNCYHGYWDNTMPENNRRVADRMEYKRKE